MTSSSDQTDANSYPRKDGPVTVLGPDVIASTAAPESGTVISWRGENFTVQPAAVEGPTEHDPKAMEALMRANQDALANPRGGHTVGRRIFAGAASHTGASLLDSLGRLGWAVVRAVPVEEADDDRPEFDALCAAAEEAADRLNHEYQDYPAYSSLMDAVHLAQAEAEAAAASPVEGATLPARGEIVTLMAPYVLYGDVMEADVQNAADDVLDLLRTRLGAKHPARDEAIGEIADEMENVAGRLSMGAERETEQDALLSLAGQLRSRLGVTG